MTDRIYEKSPRIAQTIGINLFETRSWYVDRSSLVNDYLGLLHQAERWDEKEIAEYQSSRLRQVIRFAYQEVPFYRRLYKENNIDIDKVRTVEDLGRLPIVTKSDVMKNLGEFVPARRMRARTSSTAGTTGMPLRLKLSTDCYAISRAVLKLRNGWAGYNGELLARFVGDRPIKDCTDSLMFRRSYVTKRLIFPSYCISIHNLQRILDALKKHDVRYFQAYPSTVFILAKLLQARDEYYPLKAMLYGSEPLHGFQRSLIEDRFQTKAFGFFGQGEAVVFATECERGRYHLATIDGALEIARGGEVLSPGERGYTVGTTLCNMAMPLIRYRMDDYTGYVGETCECGRHTPIIFPIDSRANDLVITPAGIIIPPGVFTYPMLQAQHVAEAQIVQRSMDEVVIKVVPADDFSSQDEQGIIDAFEECLEGTMTVRVERVTKIHQTGALKKRWIVNELPGDLFERAMSRERNT